MKVLLLTAALSMLGASATHAQTNGTLTLACRGEVKSRAAEPGEQVSMGLLVNFATKTIEGFPIGPSNITAVNQTVIEFGAFGANTIDRVTGETTAFFVLANGEPMMFLLKCKPAQRMF